MSGKLTRARRELLESLLDGEARSFADYYPPLKWALSNGLVQADERSLSTSYRITPAGRAALKEASDNG